MDGSRPRCRLCGRRGVKITAEDVFPQWLRDFTLKAVLTPEWASVMPRVKLRICAVCNANLNIKFEEPARPTLLAMMSTIVTGPISLGRDHCRAVAAWTVKTDLLYALIRLTNPRIEPGVHAIHKAQWDPDARLTSHRARLLELINDGIMPRGTSVSVAMLGDTRGRRYRELERRTDGFYTSFGVNAFVPLITECIIGDDLLERHIERRTNDGRFAVLWPPPLTSLKFPSDVVSMDEAKAFAAPGPDQHRMGLVRPDRRWPTAEA